MHYYTGESAYTKNLAMLTDLFALARARYLFITEIARHPWCSTETVVSGFSRLAQALRDHQDIVDNLFASLPREFPFTKSPVPRLDTGTPQERRAYVFREQKRYIDWQGSLNITVECRDDESHTRSVREIIKVITPMNVCGAEKIRIGGEGDGGYVMLDPGKGGIAYSLGVSWNAPWDLEMARRGFTVYQYDGSIDQEPDKHPNIFFHKCFVGAHESNGRPCKSFKQILAENQHQNEKNLILQMDIEGAEWEVFEELSAEDLLRFSQIIVELHEVHLHVYKYALLSKIRRTHTPIHVHYNNYVRDVILSQRNSLIYSGSLIEVSYVRTCDHTFAPCRDYFPTALDRPCVPHRPEIPIGCFDLMPT